MRWRSPRPFYDPRRWVGPAREASARLLERVRERVARATGQVRRGALLARMKKGDIVLASPRVRRLSPIALAYRALLGSRYVHSMLYVGGGRMIHTTARHGVVVGRVPRKVFDRQRYAVYRVPDLSEVQRDRVVAEALTRLDRPLDPLALASNIPSRWFGLRRPLLRLEEERLWCSKLIADSYQVAIGVDLVPGKSRDTVVSEDFRHSPRLEKV